MFRNIFNYNKTPKSWAARVIASETKGVPIPTSHLPCRVIDGLYISNMLTASLFLKDIAPAYYNTTSRVTHVLSIVSDRAWHLEVIGKTKESPIIQKKIFIKDLPDANLLEHFPEICSFIHSALAIPNARVLVHCHAGISHSASAIAAYLIWAHHMTHTEAIAQLRFNRPEINPNSGFRIQLVAWHIMDCELLDEEDFPKEMYTMTCKNLRLKKYHPNLLALRSFERPRVDEKKDLGQRSNRVGQLPR